MRLPEWHRNAPTAAPTPASSGTRTGRSQADLAFGTRHGVFGRPPREDGGKWTPEADEQGRVVEGWGASRLTDATRPVHMKRRSRRRR